VVKRNLLFVTFIAFLFPVGVYAEWQVKVVDIFDGDTLIVSRAGEAMIIALAGIDCPEKDQRFGLEAKEFTSGLAHGKKVTVIPLGAGRYARLTYRVYIGDTCLNEELLKAGYAWHDKSYPVDGTWDKIEQTARYLKKGLWSDKNPVPPWEFKESAGQQAKDGSYTIKFVKKHGTSMENGAAPVTSIPVK
jgi:micrococcal nuclease